MVLLLPSVSITPTSSFLPTLASTISQTLSFPPPFPRERVVGGRSLVAGYVHKAHFQVLRWGEEEEEEEGQVWLGDRPRQGRLEAGFGGGGGKEGS